jgi:hypothetical protein
LADDPITWGMKDVVCWIDSLGGFCLPFIWMVGPGPGFCCLVC